MKIAILGYSGSGKSTLARRLGQALDCPVLHLDTVQFTPCWVERDRAEAQRMVRAFMDEHQSWVIDGNYRGFEQERRLREADKIVVLDFPRRTCLRQAVKRYFRWRGKTREDMAAGCNEKLDPAFIWWVVWKGRRRERSGHLRNIAVQYPDKTTVAHNHAQVDAFFAQCTR